MIVENLRYLLSAYSPDQPVYFGCRLKARMFRYGNPDGYMTGGAGERGLCFINATGVAIFRYPPSFRNLYYQLSIPGYVLSKAAVRKFVEEALTDGRKCHLGDTDAGEDVHLARCLHNVGVKPGESRDNLGRFTFFPLNPKLLAVPMEMAIIDHSYYWRRNWYNTSREEVERRIFSKDSKLSIMIKWNRNGYQVFFSRE